MACWWRFHILLLCITDLVHWLGFMVVTIICFLGAGLASQPFSEMTSLPGCFRWLLGSFALAIRSLSESTVLKTLMKSQSVATLCSFCISIDGNNTFHNSWMGGPSGLKYDDKWKNRMLEMSSHLAELYVTQPWQITGRKPSTDTRRMVGPRAKEGGLRVWHGSHRRWLLVIPHPSPVTPHPWQVTCMQVQVETGVLFGHHGFNVLQLFTMFTV